MFENYYATLENTHGYSQFDLDRFNRFLEKMLNAIKHRDGVLDKNSEQEAALLDYIAKQLFGFYLNTPDPKSWPF